ncbi:MAG: DUF1634 domain-containing protein [Candidatus Omnitrophica bacterium]|nr:DUF1634 domain-containing protein [Candidatus Omnitrophota bacterium]
MRSVTQARWIASIDMEPLISSILRYGTLLSMGLITTGLVLRWSRGHQFGADDHLQGTNVLQFLLAHGHWVGSPRLCSSMCIRLGVAAVLVTPYLRVLASMFYFSVVERRRTHTLLTGIVAALLTYILFFG